MVLSVLEIEAEVELDLFAVLCLADDFVAVFVLYFLYRNVIIPARYIRHDDSDVIFYELSGA